MTDFLATFFAKLLAALLEDLIIRIARVLFARILPAVQTG
jgi:hypothetical protein